MQVKKFEAPTIQEALENVKRELGPEAIILQTKTNKRGFGLLSRASVEVTAAISERDLRKKQLVENRIPEASKAAIKNLPAQKQADIMDKYLDRHLEKASQTAEKVEISQKNKRITATRYIDIADEESKPKKTTSLPSSFPSPSKINLNSNIQMEKKSLEQEVHSLKRAFEEVKSAYESLQADWKGPISSKSGSGEDVPLKSTSLDNPALEDAFDQLVVSGVDRRLALVLVKKVAFELGKEGIKNPERISNQLAVEMMEGIEVLSPLAGIRPPESRDISPTVIVLIGPTGVGKTTTITKIASEASLKHHLRVGLINVDNNKIMAFEQLGTYARIINVPFRSAGSVADLKAAILDFQSLDMIMIDTAGKSQRDPEALKEMQEMLGSISNVRTFLVLSATTRDIEMMEISNRFSIFRPQGIIFSKLDEANIYGSIYNISKKVKLPLLYFTTGQKIPDDIEEASKERLTSLVLDL